MAVSNGGRLPSLILRGICTEVETLTRFALFFFDPVAFFFFFLYVRMYCASVASTFHNQYPKYEYSNCNRGIYCFPDCPHCYRVHLSNSDVYHCPACCSTTTAM